MKNPFPGMNPWLEPYWRDVHAKCLVYATDQLNAELPAGLQARVDERVATDAKEEKARQYLPHVAVTESWENPSGPVLGEAGRRVSAAEPIVVEYSPEILRHVEIVDSGAQIITAIELLSPSNKEREEKRADWRRKRFDYLRAGIHLVEIDLLRSGGWALPDPSLLRPSQPGRIYHHVAVTRWPRRACFEFYVMPLRERLPAIRVPLRRTEPDVALDLQVLINQSYEPGRYAGVINYAKAPEPPLPPDEAAWAQEVVSAHKKS